MANLQEKPFWEPGIYQLETSDPVLAGPDGIDNLQGKQLANRTAYLKQQLDGLLSGAPANLNTLQELAAALGGDAAFSATINSALAKKADKATTLAGYGIADGASKTDLQTAVNNLVSGAPANLNTLQELAAALGGDAAFSATVNSELAKKADKATTLAGYGITDAALQADLVASQKQLAQVAAKVNSRRLIRVRAAGWAVPNGVASLEIDGVICSRGARSYSFAQLDEVGGVVRSAVFDVCGSNGQDKAPADWLNAVPNGALVIVYSSDEPQSNRMTGGLPQAMYRCGASSAVFGSDKFQYRSAYILIGRAGAGEGQGFEKYAGSTPASPDAQLDVAFELVNGQTLIGSNQVAGSAIPAGQIAYFAMTSAPDGWLKCDGSYVSKATYANLYAAIQDRFLNPDPKKPNTNPGNLFCLPELRGEFIRSWDDGRGIDASSRRVGEYQLDAIQNIVGSFGLISGGCAVTSGAFAQDGSLSANHIVSPVSGQDGITTFDASRAVRTAVETRPRNVALLACIKY